MDGKIKISEDTIKLRHYIDKQEHGAEIGFMDIESDTGIKMDNRGKSLLRCAIKTSNREYSSMRGWGIKLACAKTTMPIVSTKIIKIDRAVKRAEKTTKTLQSAFFESLSQNEQQQILFAGAVFGAIRIAAENGKLLYQKKDRSKPESNEIRIAIPYLS